MAQKRMFDKQIVDTDKFLEMPWSTQALYFHLNMRADDDGFVGNTKTIMRLVNSNEDDIKILASKSFIIPFESGVIVIKHWRINNYLDKNRTTRTRYLEELSSIKEINSEYFLLEESEVSNIDQQKEKIKLEYEIKRDTAYKNSSLPYSFMYKIRQAFDDTPCLVCGENMSLNKISKNAPSIQHIMPISSGGLHEIENIAIICRSCNSSISNNKTDSLNNEEVMKKWQEICENPEYFTRLTKQPHSFNQYSIEEYSIEESRVEQSRIEENRTEEESETQKQLNKDIAEVISYFKEINPTQVNQFYMRKVEKEACRDLLELFSKEELKEIITKAGNYNKFPFISSYDKIYSPTTLQRNYQKLKDKEAELKINNILEKKKTDSKLPNVVDLRK